MRGHSSWRHIGHTGKREPGVRENDQKEEREKEREDERKNREREEGRGRILSLLTLSVRPSTVCYVR